MKKVIFSTALVTLFLASCTKEYTCDCTSTSIPDQSYTLTEKNQEDAEATCSSYDDNTGGAVTCTLQ